MRHVAKYFEPALILCTLTFHYLMKNSNILPSHYMCSLSLHRQQSSVKVSPSTSMILWDLEWACWLLKSPTELMSCEFLFGLVLFQCRMAGHEVGSECSSLVMWVSLANAWHYRQTRWNLKAAQSYTNFYSTICDLLREKRPFGERVYYVENVESTL